MDSPNDLHHVFGNPRHNLERLVRLYGSREEAGRAIQEAVEIAFRAGKLAFNARGVFEAVLDVGGNRVTVRGIIHASRPRIGSAWIIE